MESLTEEITEQSVRLNFKALNNEAEYAALIAGLKSAKEARALSVVPLCDSQLVVSQYNGEFNTKKDRMESYLKVVKDLEKIQELQTFAHPLGGKFCSRCIVLFSVHFRSRA